jgi:hypothetical protein
MFQPLVSAFEAAAGGQIEGIITLVLFVSGLACIRSLFLQFSVDRWPTTTGVLRAAGVVQANASQFASDKRFIEDVEYEYEVDGEAYVGRTLSPWTVLSNTRGIPQHRLRGLFPGQSTTVIYHPKRHSRSYLTRAGHAGKVITVSLMLALMSVPWLIFG